MKETQTIEKITCDNCKKKTIEILNKTGFPYKEGWIYSYNIAIKFPLASSITEGEIMSKRVEIKDKHFCSGSCFLQYLAQLLTGKDQNENK